MPRVQLSNHHFSGSVGAAPVGPTAAQQVQAATQELGVKMTGMSAGQLVAQAWLFQTTATDFFLHWRRRSRRSTT
jgi:hypothetical protein